METKVWKAGIPTEPDVKRLIELFGKSKEGDMILHEDIEAVVKADRATFRYGTIVRAFRREMEHEFDVVFGAVRGVGYRVLTNNERVDAGVGKLRCAFRSTSRAGELASGADKTRLSAEHRIKADHIGKLHATIAGAFRTRAKSLRDEIIGTKQIAG